MMQGNLETRHFALFRAPDDLNAVPREYHAYFVYASPWERPNFAIATIVSLVEGTPMPASGIVLVEEGGVLGALDKAEEIIRSLPANKGLKRLPAKDR
jgi:hypothetical protein